MQREAGAASGLFDGTSDEICLDGKKSFLAPDVHCPGARSWAAAAAF
jgi:hypothetical protein